jgi:predicted CoA-binding protein
MSAVAPEERELRSILGDARTVAVVGLSGDRSRPSHRVARYLQSHGYRIIPVNPNETEVLGEPAFPSLLDIPEDLHIDVVDVFRQQQHTPEIAEQAVRIGAGVLWLQEGILNENAYRIASEGGLEVIMGLCMRHTREELMEEAEE